MLTAFNLPHVRALDAGQRGQRLLRDAALKSRRAHRLTEGDSRRALKACCTSRTACLDLFRAPHRREREAEAYFKTTLKITQDDLERRVRVRIANGISRLAFVIALLIWILLACVFVMAVSGMNMRDAPTTSVTLATCLGASFVGGVLLHKDTRAHGAAFSVACSLMSAMTMLFGLGVANWVADNGGPNVSTFGYALVAAAPALLTCTVVASVVGVAALGVFLANGFRSQ